MTTTSTVVIIGGGLAAAKTAEALRSNEFDGSVVVIAEEDHLPYERPPLSKEFLADKKGLDDFTVHDKAWYADSNIDLRTGTKVTAIDRSAHTVQLADGGTVDYDTLVLATGSRSRRPRIAGADAAGVHYLRTIDDASDLKSILQEGSSLAIVGAGWIGMEVAAAARDHGVDVTIVEAAKLPLLAALGPEAAEVFANLHREKGVNLLFESSVAEVTSESGAATGLKLDDGSTIAADNILIAVGAAPNVELAEAAGLDMADGGVKVDATLRASDPDIYAVGDIAAAEHPFFGTRIRTEHWANALKQPAVAAANIVGEKAEYDELPYFFTDQYDLGMEYLGHADGYHEVVFRGDVDGREFIAFWLDGEGHVLAAMNVNVWDVADDVKELIRSRGVVSREGLEDLQQPWQELGGRA
jgi:3-phenylpropionate/trans-cinnamate dioxygenase ferredoxin reductase component